MPQKREKLLIINRSFWPVYPIVGEALLRFAEQHAALHEINIVLQDHVGIRQKLKEHQRGKGVNFFPCKAWTVSGSSVIRRALDAIFFMFWVFFILLWKRPSKVYVSTDPPILVPFIVFLYSKLFKVSYIYHLQDIHPEAANVVVKINPFLFNFLKRIDILSMKNAETVITLTKEMAEEIYNRSNYKGCIKLLSNPSVDFNDIEDVNKKLPGIVFCGNAGRLQRMPLIISSIKNYLNKGGRLNFVFAGAGVFSKDLESLSNKYPENVKYYGVVSPIKAAKLNCMYEWALLPIEDEVTRYAFPSKSSSYVFSNAKILAVCANETSVAQWVISNKLGCVVNPSIDILVDFFFRIENKEISEEFFDMDRFVLKKNLNFSVFVDNLSKFIFTEDE